MVLVALPAKLYSCINVVIQCYLQGRP